MYCIDSNFVTFKTFGFNGIDDEILNLKNYKAARVNIEKLKDIFALNFKTFEDKSGGSVAFVKNCSIMDMVQEQFLKKIANQHDGIRIDYIKIELKSKIPKNFNSYKLINIKLNGLSSDHGMFRAIFESDDLNRKNLYFKYSFKAKISVFMALKKVSQGQILSAFDYQKSFIDFKRYNKNSIKKLNNSRFMARNNINAGDILLKYHLVEVSLVRKRDRLNAVLSDGGLNLLVEVIALENGNLGDNIMVKTKDGKTLKANVSSKNQVIIR